MDLKIVMLSLYHSAELESVVQMGNRLYQLRLNQSAYYCATTFCRKLLTRSLPRPNIVPPMSVLHLSIYLPQSSKPTFESIIFHFITVSS